MPIRGLNLLALNTFRSKLVVRMDTRTVLELIRDYTVRRCEERGLPKSDVGEGTILLGDANGLDSVDLATLVFELQEATGEDPFEQGYVPFQTAGDLARLFGVTVQ
jgi:acyl carrier protein